MDIGDAVSWIIYLIFFLMTIIYFYLFKKDRVLIHLYFSLTPTFLCIYLLMNYHHYQPVEGAWTLAFLMFISLFTVMASCMIYTFFKHHD